MCEKCCICLNDIEETGQVILKCGHKIHLKCFMECLKNDTIFCPLCRKKIDEMIKYYNYLNKKLNFLYKNHRDIIDMIKNFTE